MRKTYTNIVNRPHQDNRSPEIKKKTENHSVTNVAKSYSFHQEHNDRRITSSSFSNQPKSENKPPTSYSYVRPVQVQ